ncbi:hypothetical protein Pst134EA_020777 [Puccinia striiformis f. sp. tritici]|uniref:hypothetical protein n=1 Tax=Puccinia striiformis f. sp. tritici TaxID=168172 RepID=UPI002008CF88|nr:hypothetical protein Pst134EA_020777 [Puccinia striiformis f. sp. tritici]KAH9456866.1 hypothetical protein Pst134EA_020777 [Puccinia striiformis f. sp. tritici]
MKPSKVGMEESPYDYEMGGYHPVKIGDKFHENRYSVIRKLGYGQFSTVWLAHDQQQLSLITTSLDQCPVSILTIFSTAPHTQTHTFLTWQARSARLPQNQQVGQLLHQSCRGRNSIPRAYLLGQSSPPGYCHVATLLDHFKHEGPNGTHVCLVFEVLGESVDALKERYKKVPAPIVRKIGRQVLLGLDYLHRECGIFHLDLKPANVLICIEDVERVISSELESPPKGGYNTKTSIPLKSTPARSVRPGQTDHSDYSNITIKITDLGSGTWATNRPTEGIVCRPYRSPELMIDAPWDQRVDIWSVGCTLGELLTGDFIFKAYSNVSDEDYLYQVIGLVGPYPMESAKSGKYFLEEITQINRMVEGNRARISSLEERFRFEHRFDQKLIECILGMLQIDPSKRWQAKQILDAKGWLGTDKM